MISYLLLFEGVTAGGCRNYLETFWHNPQYVVSLEDPDEDDDDGLCTIIVALMQKNRRSRRNMGMDCLTIGFAIYHVSERDLMNKPLKQNFFKYNASVARSPAFINLREVRPSNNAWKISRIENIRKLHPNWEIIYKLCTLSNSRSVADSNCRPATIWSFRPHSNRTKRVNF